MDKLTKNKSRVGMTNIQRVTGQKYKLVEWNGTNDIIVEFEDKTRVRSSFAHFKEGKIQNPNFTYVDHKAEERSSELVGTQVVAKNGMVMTIIKFVSNANVTVRFEDNAETQCRLSAFKRGQVRHPGGVDAKVMALRKERKGHKFKTVQGLSGQVLEYDNSESVLIKLETGLEKTVKWRDIKSGKVFDPKWKSDQLYQGLIGKKYSTLYGIDATITGVEDTFNVTAEFEDKVKVKTSVYNLSTGKVGHPDLSCHVGGVTKYKGMTCKLMFATHTDRYYLCQCPNCSFSEILTVKQMQQPHICSEL